MVTKEKNQTIFVKFDQFRIGNETSKYTMKISGQYSGNASGISTFLSFNNNMKFSTYDSDNDLHKIDHCAAHFQAGWWYHGCHWSLLTGRYGSSDLVWITNNAKSLELKFVEIKFR
eukprot:TCONS_00022085-protein